MNLHGLGAQLMNWVRPSVAGFPVIYSRGDSLVSKTFEAGSPPSTRTFITSSGLELGKNDRVFIIPKHAICELFYEPQRADTIVDKTDGSVWSVRPPDGSQDHWRWHGQTRDAYLVYTRKDTSESV